MPAEWRVDCQIEVKEVGAIKVHLAQKLGPPHDLTGYQQERDKKDGAPAIQPPECGAQVRPAVVVARLGPAHDASCVDMLQIMTGLAHLRILVVLVMITAFLRR
jgi:hypothetical protein